MTSNMSMGYWLKFLFSIPVYGNLLPTPDSHTSSMHPIPVHYYTKYTYSRGKLVPNILI